MWLRKVLFFSIGNAASLRLRLAIPSPTKCLLL